MKPGDLVKELRLKNNITAEELAKSIGINVEHYYDLEQYETFDVCSNLDLVHIKRICELLAVDLTQILPRGTDVKNISDLHDAIREKMVTRQLDVAGFSAIVGWDIAPFMVNPKAMDSWSIDCLIDVCGFANVNWRDMIDIYVGTRD